MPISPELLKKVGGVVVKPNTGAAQPTAQPSPKPPAPSNGASLDLNKLNLNDGSLSVISAPKKQLTGADSLDLEKAKTGLKPYEPKKEATILERLDVALNIFKPSTANTEMSRLLLSTLPETASNLKDTAVAFGKTLKTQIQNFDINEKRDINNPKGNILFTKLLTEELENDNNWIDGTLKAFQKYNDENVIKPMEEELEARKKEFNIKDEDLIQDLAAALPSGLAFAGTAIGTGGISALTKMAGLAKTAKGIEIGGKVLAFVTEAGMEATSVRNQILGDGGTEEEAAEGYVSTLGLNAIAIGLTNKWSGIFDMTSTQGIKGFMKAVATATGFEGLQEGLQQVIANSGTGRPIWDGVDRAMLVGAIFGGTLKGTTSVGANLGSQFFRVFKPNATPAENKEIIENFIEENKALIPADQIEKAREILDGANEQRTEEIMSETLTSGQVEEFTEVINQVKSEQQALEEELIGIYQQQVAAGISPTIIYQELSERTGIPVEEIKSTITELDSRPKESDPIKAIADQLRAENGIELLEKSEEPNSIESIAQKTLEQDEAMSPQIMEEMENDAEQQADWDRNYRVEYGDYNKQETYLRGREQQYTQRAAKAKVLAQISRLEGKKQALKEEYKKNNTQVETKDVEKAIKEKNPKKANRVLNQVGKEKTSKVVKNGKGVVRVNRITDTEKVSKRQAEKRAKVENPSFLELKKGIHPLNETTDEQNQTIEQSKFQDLIRGVDVRQNAYETSFTIGNTTFRFDTQTFNDFMQERDPNEISYYVKGEEIFLVDMNYGDWEMNSIVGQVIEQTPQASTLFQRSSRHRFATPRDIEKAFDNIPFLKYVRVEKVNEIKTPGGGGAWGSYFDGLIKYTETSKYGTLPHEAFHAFTDLVLSPEERQTMYDTARVEMYSDGYTLPITDLQTEEYLAEKFEDYYINKTEQSSLSRFFDKIIQALKSLVQSKKTIDDYFNSVFDPQTQLYQKPNREMKPINGEFILAFSPKTVEEAREIVDGAEITEEEKNFLYAVLDNPAYSKKTNWDAVMDEMKIRALQVEGRVLNGRQNMIVRGDEELGINPDNGFAWVVSTNLEHGERTSHGFTDGGNAIAWANVAETKDGWGEYIVKEIQKISGAVLNPAINNSDYTAQEKKEAKTLHQNYMDLMVISLLDKAANDGKIIKFPSPENAQRVNTQANPELIEKVYEKQMVDSLKKFAEPELMSNPDGEWYVVYPSQVAKQNAHRFQTADVFESIQQENLTTKILNRLGDRKTVSKTFISDLAKMPDIKQKEKEIINEVLKGEPNTINVEEFKQKVRAELLPLDVVSEGSSSDEQTVQYEAYTLDKKERGSVREYLEKVYGSPVKTSAGNRHFRGVDNYFGHTRVERMNDGETIRVVEVQTDLFQKNNFDAESLDKWEITAGKAMLEFENGNQVFALETNPMTGELEIGEEMKSSQQISDSQYWAFAAKNKERNSELKKLEVYGNPTSHFRMAREEINHFAKSASDYKRIQFPTGITALKIEGHWSRYAPTSNTEPDHGWVMYVDQTDSFAGEVRPLKPTDLKAGLIVKDRYGTKWIVVYIKPTGEMVVVKYNNQFIEDAKEQDPDFEGTDFEVGQRYAQSIFDHIEEDAGSFYGAESFNIGRVKTSDEYKKNPLYKFYEGDLGKYLKNTFNAKEVTDAQGVTWFEIALTPEMAGRVEAFQEQNVYDKMAKALVELQMRNRENSMNQTFAQRTAEELDIILNSQGIKYTPSMIKEEMAKSELAYKKDKVKSIELALKGESPKDILPLAFGKYVLGKVTQEGNVDTQRKVLEKISTTATVMGQNIAMLKGRVNLDDPNSFASKLLQQKKQLAIRNWKPIFGKAKTIEEIVETEVKVQKKRVKKLSEELLQAKTLEMEAFFEAIKC